MSTEEYKVKVVRLGTGEIEIVANRSGLESLAEICEGLSRLSNEEAQTAANHWHLADYMNNAEDGSLELIIRFDPHL